MLAIYLPSSTDKLFGALLFQKNKDFVVYVPEADNLAGEYETKLHIERGTVASIPEPLLCILEPGALPDPYFVRRVLHTTGWHPHFDVYHVNLMEGKAFPRKMRLVKFFKQCVAGPAPAPLSSFIFRTGLFREKAVFKADGTLDVLPTVMGCARVRPIRRVWRALLPWTAPALPQDPASVQRRVRDLIGLFRWTETFFGEEDYPLGTGEALDLFASAVAQLYPSYTEDELKEEMRAFVLAQGPIRKMRAAAALKSALRTRVQALSGESVTPSE